MAMEVLTHKRKVELLPPNGAKRNTRSQTVLRNSVLQTKTQLANLNYNDPEKLEAFFQEYSSIPIPLGLDGDQFTPWKGGSSNRAQFRLWDCGHEYVNPPEDLKVLGYLGYIEEDIVIMVGTQSGRVYMDEDEIVYIVADSLSEFAQQGCRKHPEFFDYYKARPNDEKSLPCAAGSVEDEEYDVSIVPLIMIMITFAEKVMQRVAFVCL
ncbi:Hypp8650 [Branchiostoma lanceolatum]|uniref:Hypp8650 protein n=1 Tax=Branchiostoma lanceolatum TaxID=7740 RepID=A0A8K0EG30_BRALA|nr:Hypp8650 [Branchiostoma lanceolatum]